MLLRENVGTLPDFEHVSSVGARFVAYKNGVRVYFKTPDGEPPTRGDSATILDQSDASRRRAAFALGNAECDWLAMSCLTYHSAPSCEDVVKHQEKLARAFRSRWGEPICGWIKEFQTRGVPHFHLFRSAQSMVGKFIANGERAIRDDDGREISRGNFDYWLRDVWLKISGQKDDHEAAWWHSRGIVEFFKSADAAGRYVAKESAKREQKVLPSDFMDGIGRWWGLARRWAPRPRAFGTLDLHEWPFDVPASLIWEGETIAECFAEIHNAPRSIADVKLFLYLNGFGSDPRSHDDGCELSTDDLEAPAANLLGMRHGVSLDEREEKDLWGRLLPRRANERPAPTT